MTEQERNSIILLAECVKELCRIDPHFGPGFEGTPVHFRLEQLYKKAVLAKNIMEEVGK